MSQSTRKLGFWMPVVAGAMAVNLLTASCSSQTDNTGSSSAPTPETSGSNTGVQTPAPSGTDTPDATLRVPTDLVNKTVEDASAQLLAAGILFTTLLEEAEESQVGRVVRVEPAAGTVLRENDRIHLIVGKTKDGTPSTPVRPGDLTITGVEFIRIPPAANCQIVVTVFNNLSRTADRINVTGHVQMRDQDSSRFTLDFSRHEGLQNLEPQTQHPIYGEVTFERGVTASYQFQVVQDTQVIDEVAEQLATCE
ncbi:exported hypothetical protein [Arthrobacter sp. 9AX]|nr:exported hypothetical protein [Arthrobacter sp. 9AX]